MNSVSKNMTNEIEHDEPKMQKSLLWLLLSLLLIVIDQISKFWAEARLKDGSTFDIFPVLNFELAYNTGAAFSFLANAGGWQKFFFSAIAIGVSVYLTYAISKAKVSEKQLVIAYSLVIAGAIGNLIDRIRIEKVVDFIHVFYQNWHFPYFNVADMAISIGAILLIMEAFNWKIIR